MGSMMSKKAASDGDGTEEPPINFIFYDQHGILRKGIKADDGELHNRDKELQRVLALEKAWKDMPAQMQRVWYIVESGWIRTWLSYVRFGTSSLGESFSSPAPGPINNECLLLMVAEDVAEVPNFDGGVPTEWPKFHWIPKSGLLAASKDTQGHYRRVNSLVWESLCKWYKGSGPAIRYEEEAVSDADVDANDEKDVPGEQKTTSDQQQKDTASKANDEEEKGRDDDHGVATDATDDEAPIITDPDRWKNSSLWEVDQSQDRFCAKFSEVQFPDKSEDERRRMIWSVWNSKRLKKDKENDEALKGTDDALNEQAQKTDNDAGVEESKEELDADKNKEDESEDEEEEEEVPGNNEHSNGDGTEATSNPLSSQLTDLSDNEKSASTKGRSDGDRKASIAPEFDQIFMRPPSHEKLDRSSQEAQAILPAMQNGVTKK